MHSIRSIVLRHSRSIWSNELLAVSITRRRLEPCAGHVFAKKFGGRSTGLRVHQEWIGLIEN